VRIVATLRHALASYVIGGLLGVVSWCAYALLIMQRPFDAAEAVGVGLIGGFCAAVASASVSAWCRRAKAASPAPEDIRPDFLMTKLVEAAPKSNGSAAEPAAPRGPQTPAQKPPRRPALRGRISATFRWEAASGRLQRFLQRSGEELHGQSIFHALHPEDLDAVEKALLAARTSKAAQTVTCRWLPNGNTPVDKRRRPAFRSDTQLLPSLDPRTLLYARLRLRPRFSADGRLLGYRCRLTDLTRLQRAEAEQKRVTAELAATRRRLDAVGLDLDRLKVSYRELYHNSPVMYFSLDPKGRLVTFNDTLLRALGLRRSDLAGHPYVDLLAPDLRADPTAAAGHTPSGEGELETRWRKKDGTVVDIWIRTVAVLDETGGLARFRSAALDLTEKNRLSHELRARGDELERANARLRTINIELEDFTHVVSHDLKEPLRTLQAYSNILAEEFSAQLGPDGFQYINHLIHASRRLGKLIDELLNLSQAGRITRTPQVFNLIEAVATVRQDLVDLIQRREATILTEGSLPHVVGDPHRITQLLANLVANGLKYNQSPLPQVVIGTQPAADPKQVIVTVRDNGIGIDPAFHDQIFGIFRRLHQPDQYEGTGAGLAICKKIVEAHGGRIWVESVPGQGATFSFTLPRPAEVAQAEGAGRLPQAPARTEEPIEPRSAARPPSTRKPAAVRNDARPHIVLVEDTADFGMLIQKLGKRSGLDITWFTTAEEAWDYLKAQEPDFLLFDINLPGMDGVELCRRVRMVPALKRTPIALFSQDLNSEQLEKLQAAGANFFLSKDLLCQPAAWQHKLRELLEQTQVGVTN
jgi:PAS domain S-box-containing protein